MPKLPLDRRQFLRIAGLTALGTATACAGRGKSPLPASLNTFQSRVNAPGLVQGTYSKDRKRSLRIAHLTDFHVLPFDYPQGEVVKALRHAQSQADERQPSPDIRLTAGDQGRNQVGGPIQTADNAYLKF